MPTLPVELWSRVFVLNVDDYPCSLQNIRLVNHTFQSIADQTPQLWNRLLLTKERHLTDVPRVRTLLRRSGALPLDVYILFVNDLPDDLPEVGPLADLLGEKCIRIHSLVLRLLCDKVITTILSSIAQGWSMPLLEKFVLSHKMCEIPLPTLQSILPNAPRLTYLKIPQILIPLSVQPPASFFYNIQTFVIRINCEPLESLVQFLLILHFMLNLTSFDFGAWNYDDEDPNLPSTILVSTPRLESARVTINGHGLRVLRHLDAPLLVEVEIDAYPGEGFDDHWEWDDPLTELLIATLRHLSDRSPRLSSLNLIHTMMPDPDRDYRWILSDRFPSLARLDLHWTDITDDAIQSCSAPENLKLLILFQCDGVSGAGLRPFVQARDGDFQLLIESCQGVTPEDADELSKFVIVEYGSYALLLNVSEALIDLEIVRIAVMVQIGQVWTKRRKFNVPTNVFRALIVQVHVD